MSTCDREYLATKSQCPLQQKFANAWTKEVENHRRGKAIGQSISEYKFFNLLVIKNTNHKNMTPGLPIKLAVLAKVQGEVCYQLPLGRM